MSSTSRPVMSGPAGGVVGVLALASTLLAACDSGPKPSGNDASASAVHPDAKTPTTPTLAPSDREPPRTLRPPRTPGVVAPEQLPLGPPPRVPYAAWHMDPGVPWPRQVVVTPDGGPTTRLQVDRQGNEGYRHLSFAPYSDGWLTMFDAFGAVAMVLGPDGSLRRAIGTGPGHVFSRPGRQEIVFDFIPASRVGFATDVATLGPDGLRRLGPARSSAGFLGAHEVVVTRRDGVYRIDTRSRSETRVPGLSTAQMVSSRSDRLIGVSDGIHGVYDARTGVPVLESPHYRLQGFNPSGELALAYRRTPDRSAELAMVHVDSGRVLESFRRRARGRPQQIVWEDDRTVLVDFVRLRLDGTIERARLPQPGLHLLPPPIS